MLLLDRSSWSVPVGCLRHGFLGFLSQIFQTAHSGRAQSGPGRLKSQPSLSSKCEDDWVWKPPRNISVVFCVSSGTYIWLSIRIRKCLINPDATACWCYRYTFTPACGKLSDKKIADKQLDRILLLTAFCYFSGFFIEALLPFSGITVTQW